MLQFVVEARAAAAYERLNSAWAAAASPASQWPIANIAHVMAGPLPSVHEEDVTKMGWGGEWRMLQKWKAEGWGTRTILVELQVVAAGGGVHGHEQGEGQQNHVRLLHRLPLVHVKIVSGKTAVCVRKFHGVVTRKNSRGSALVRAKKARETNPKYSGW